MLGNINGNSHLERNLSLAAVYPLWCLFGFFLNRDSCRVKVLGDGMDLQWYLCYSSETKTDNSTDKVLMMFRVLNLMKGCRPKSQILCNLLVSVSVSVLVSANVNIALI